MDDKTPPMDVNEGRVIAFVDIETDSLDATKIYVCCVKRTTDKQVQVYTDPDKIKKETTDIDKFIGHNIIDFDAPILDKLWGTNLTIVKIYDTLVLSQILSPQREGGNSLKAWGVRLGNTKGDYTGSWEQFNDEMLSYCIQDVHVTDSLWKQMY